jgi:septum formation protein
MPNSEPLSGLVLASSSPRRQEMFTRLFGAQGFRVAVPDFDESCVPLRANTRTYVREVSRAKCGALLRQEPEGDYLVVAADTVVTLDGRILGKPADGEDACGCCEAFPDVGTAY